MAYADDVFLYDIKYSTCSHSNEPAEWTAALESLRNPCCLEFAKERADVSLYRIGKNAGLSYVPIGQLTTLSCQSRATAVRLIRRHKRQFRTSYSLFTIPLG